MPDATVGVPHAAAEFNVRHAHGNAHPRLGGQGVGLQPAHEHPHGLSDRDFDGLFTTDKPVIFNFHGYPWLIHRMTYKRANRQLHVRGYKEKGSINTPMELAINNQIDRFSLAIDVIDRVPRLRVAGAAGGSGFEGAGGNFLSSRIRTS